MNQKAKLIASVGFFVAMGGAVIAINLGKDEAMAEVVVGMPEGTTAADAAAAGAAVEVLLDRCSILRDPRFSNLRASVGDAAYTFMAERWGWQRFVRVEVKNADNGHTLQYAMGGGDQPGIYVYKGDELDVCGFPAAPAGLLGSYVAEERLASVDQD